MLPNSQIKPLTRLEDTLVGPMPNRARSNMRIELLASLAYGPFHAALLFVPVVLQRLGSSAELIAFYQSASYIGFLLVPLTARFIPARGLPGFLASVWAIGRSFFVLMGLAASAPIMLLLSVFYFFFDSFPSPAYTRVIQLIYPANIRGRVLGYVRIGLAGGMLLVTPICGWVLDNLGYVWLFPICGLCGVAAARLFSRIQIDESSTPTQEKRSPSQLWQVLKHDRRYQYYLLAVAFFGFGGLIPAGFYPAVFVNRLNLSYTEVSLLGAVQSVSWLIGYLVWGHFLDRFNGVIGLRVVFAILSIIPISHMLASNGLMMLPAFIAAGLGSAGVDLAFQNCTIELARDDQTYEYAALQRTVIGIRGLIAPMLGVWLVQMGMSIDALFIFGSSLYLVAVALMMHPSFRQSTIM
jgi:MFS family permease